MLAELDELVIGLLRLIGLLLGTFGQITAIFFNFSVKFIQNANFSPAALQLSCALLGPSDNIRRFLLESFHLLY
jgi:hypothetical protein